MARKKSPDGEPTPFELEVLQVLWEHGPCNVRFVNDQLNTKKDVAYTTTLKIMQIMHDKGLLLRDNSAMTHIYMPAVKEEATKNAMLNRFVNAVFGGSPTDLMVQLMGGKKPSKDELKILKDMIKKYDK